MKYNIWDNPSEDMLKTAEEIQERTGIDSEKILRVLKEHHQIYMEQVEKSFE